MELAATSLMAMPLAAMHAAMIDRSGAAVGMAATELTVARRLG